MRQAFILANKLRENYPYVTLSNIHNQIKAQRTIKKPCEIDAMRYAETITCEGIQAMMRASRDGMYEYQYKAEFDYALAQRGVLSPGFPSIVSAGKNNFCIHYYSYKGQAHDGDMVLNDVGACWDRKSMMYPEAGPSMVNQRKTTASVYLRLQHFQLYVSYSASRSSHVFCGSENKAV